VTRTVRIVALVGALVVLVGAGVFVGMRFLSDQVDKAIPQEDLFGDETPAPTTPAAPPTTAPPAGSDIKGPLNFLIAGVDTRVSKPGWIPRADAVMIMHVNKSLTKAWLTSLPRDLVVNVPAFAKAGYGGGRTKLTHAMSYGAVTPGTRRRSMAQGFQLLARTVSNYTGIKRWDGGAVVTFGGLTRIVDAVGGIDIYVDQNVVSLHRTPSGGYRTPCRSCEHGYSGPRASYKVGKRHFKGWQAIDYARQRYIPGADYARGRHQRQIIQAIVAKAFSRDLATDPVRLKKVLDSLGSALVFDGRGRKPTEFAYALRNIEAKDITLVGLPGGGAYSGGSYIGENLSGRAASVLRRAAGRRPGRLPRLPPQPGQPRRHLTAHADGPHPRVGMRPVSVRGVSGRRRR
jgi:LCP family protein required for cell wall assembly